MTPIKLLSSDLDGTLLGNSCSTLAFLSSWNRLSLGDRPVLCYNSGRLVRDVLGFLRLGHLPWPDYVIGGVGTEIFDCRRKRYLRGFQDSFRGSWNLGLITKVMREANIRGRQPALFNDKYKSSWFVAGATQPFLLKLSRAMAEAGLMVRIVYSSNRDLDVIPSRAGKGEAVRWLARELKLPLKATLVAGDSGNDVTMLDLPGVRRIVVANAHPDLSRYVKSQRTFRARAPFAAGVLQGLRHFGVLESEPVL